MEKRKLFAGTPQQVTGSRKAVAETVTSPGNADSARKSPRGHGNTSRAQLSEAKSSDILSEAVVLAALSESEVPESSQTVEVFLPNSSASQSSSSQNPRFIATTSKKKPTFEFVNVKQEFGFPQDDDDAELCLLCGVNLDTGELPDLPDKMEIEDEAEILEGVGAADDDDDIPVRQEDVRSVERNFPEEKLEKFLQETFQLNNLPGTSRGHGDRKGRLADFRGNEQSVRNFCTNCKVRIARLHDLQQRMKAVTQEYEKDRDNIATKFILTYLAKTKPTDFPLEVFKSSVAKKWKELYSGDAQREKDVVKMLKEKETELNRRDKKFAKLQASCLPGKEKGFTKRWIGLPGGAVKRAPNKVYASLKPRIVKRNGRSTYVITLPRSGTRSSWGCSVCDKKFAYEYSLRLHLRTHAKQMGKLFSCSLCTAVFASRQKLNEHRRSDHTAEELEFKCKICNYPSKSRNALKAHLKTHGVELNNTCEICGESFRSQFTLKTHMQEHKNVDLSVVDLFTCKTCSQTFLKSQELTEHLRVHNESNLKCCTFCGKVFEKEVVLQQHIKALHTGGNPYICDECGIRFPSNALLVSHLKTHRPKSFICKICNKACRSRDGLRKHELTHSGRKPYQCKMCSMGFIERKSFDAHMVRHTGKLPYKCSYCNTDEGFKDAMDLRRHKVLKHPQYTPADKMYTCEQCWNGFPSQETVDEHKKKIHERYKCQHCDKIFKLGDHLRRHMYIHTGEKPYKCALCDKTFNQESNLKEHMYRHTGLRPHQCPHCPTIGFMRKMHLREHMFKVHGTDIVAQVPRGRNAQRHSNVLGTLDISSGVIKLEPQNSNSDMMLPSSSNCYIVLK